jgi:hypothetical protein
MRTPMKTPAFTVAPNAHAKVRSFQQSTAVCSQRKVNNTNFAQKPSTSIEESKTVLSQDIPVEPIFCMESGDLHELFKAPHSEWSPSKIEVHLAPASSSKMSEIPKKGIETSNQYTKLFAD